MRELYEEGERGLDRGILEERFVLMANVLERLRCKRADRNLRSENPAHLIYKAGPPC
ncbi:MAG: hypothetical protein M5U12_37940 [Verrucomicrobia bacterium]|nr:hypothetical protein [Verrucomicrobiota bacterium]